MHLEDKHISSAEGDLQDVISITNVISLWLVQQFQFEWETADSPLWETASPSSARLPAALEFPLVTQQNISSTSGIQKNKQCTVYMGQYMPITDFFLKFLISNKLIHLLRKKGLSKPTWNILN